MLTPAQLVQIKEAVRDVFREEMGDIGLRLDSAESVEQAREDMRFIRRFRRSWDGAVSKVGNAVLIGVLALCGVIASTGFWAWIHSGGAK